MKETEIGQKVKIRDQMLDNIDLIDEYVKENPNGLAVEDLKIIESWKKYNKRDFLLLNL